MTPLKVANRKRLSSVEAALRILKAFDDETTSLGVTELSKHLGVAKSTAHRLVSTLQAEGFLEQNPQDARYHLGLTLFSLGALVRRRMDISSQALPHLALLRDQTSETVHLSVLDKSDVLYLYNLESPQAIRMRSYLGTRKPALSTSEGRAILAFSPPAVVQLALKAQRLARTPHTLTASSHWLSCLKEVQNNRCALDLEESEPGMVGLAAPIFNAQGEVVAAVGIGGPVQRLNKKNLKAFTPMVMQAAQAISVRLGF